jgi:hypothetical protein
MRAAQWLESTYKTEAAEVEASARRFALTLGRSAELAYLVRHADWAKKNENDDRPTLAAKRFLAHGIDLLALPIEGSSRRLGMDL